VDAVQDPLLFFLVVPGIEPGPPNLTTRPQRRSGIRLLYLDIAYSLGASLAVPDCSLFERSNINHNLIYDFWSFGNEKIQKSAS
jgi:hypothetical protein